MEEVTADEAKEIIHDTLPKSIDTLEPKSSERRHFEDVYCSVSKPEKVGEGMNAYVTYVIATKKPDGSLASIARRYSDFSWLHETLRSEFLNILVPPMPEKAIFDRFSPEFVEYRRKELERFLKRVLDHPQLSKSDNVKLFLTANEATMDVERAKPKLVVTPVQPPPKKEEKGFFAYLTESLTSAVTGPTVELKEVDPWFESQRAYLANLDQHLQVLVQRSNANTRKKQEMVASLTDFAHAASLACGCEVGQDDGLADYWSKLSEILNQISTLTDELVHGETDLFEDQVKDYVRLVSACKDLVENRNVALLDLQFKQADATLKSERLQKAQGGYRAPSLIIEVQEANDATESASQTFNTLSKSVKSELDVFKQNKGHDIRKALRELVRLNINHQLRVVNLWKELLSELEETNF